MKTLTPRHKLTSQLRFIASQLAREALEWSRADRRPILNAALQCTEQAVKVQRAPDGSAWHAAGEAYLTTATDMLVALIVSRTPAGIKEGGSA